MLDLTGKTMASLLQSMLLRVTEQVNKRDGSLIKTALSAAAWAIEGIYIELIDVQKQAYGTTATGSYLDLKVAERGLTRHQATSEVCELLCNLSTLELGFQLADSSGYTWEVTSGVISGPDADDLYTYRITCQTSGAIPEPTGSLRSLSFLAGLSVAIFGNVIAVGVNAETDDSLRKRYEESLIEIAFSGNVAAYREQMLDMEYAVGATTATIGAMQVFSCVNESGNIEGGHVRIYVVDSDYGVASQELLDAIQAAICPMYNGHAVAYGNGFAPIGANVHIMSATSTPVLEIDVTVSVSPSSSLPTVEPVIRQNILNYVNSQIRNWGEQVDSPYNTASITIRQAFVYAASLVQGVSDVTSVVMKKNNVIGSGAVSWDTTRQGMEWINVDDIVINISQA